MNLGLGKIENSSLKLLDSFTEELVNDKTSILIYKVRTFFTKNENFYRTSIRDKNGITTIKELTIPIKRKNDYSRMNQLLIFAKHFRDYIQNFSVTFNADTYSDSFVLDITLSQKRKTKNKTIETYKEIFNPKKITDVDTLIEWNRNKILTDIKKGDKLLMVLLAIKYLFWDGVLDYKEETLIYLFMLLLKALDLKAKANIIYRRITLNQIKSFYTFRTLPFEYIYTEILPKKEILQLALDTKEAYSNKNMKRLLKYLSEIILSKRKQKLFTEEFITELKQKYFIDIVEHLDLETIFSSIINNISNLKLNILDLLIDKIITSKDFVTKILNRHEKLKFYFLLERYKVHWEYILQLINFFKIEKLIILSKGYYASSIEVITSLNEKLLYDKNKTIDEFLKEKSPMLYIAFLKAKKETTKDMSEINVKNMFRSFFKLLTLENSYEIKQVVLFLIYSVSKYIDRFSIIVNSLTDLYNEYLENNQYEIASFIENNIYMIDFE